MAVVVVLDVVKRKFDIRKVICLFFFFLWCTRRPEIEQRGHSFEMFYL